MRQIKWMIFCAIILISLTGINVKAASCATYYYDGQWHNYNEQPVALEINGETMDSEVPPVVLNNHTLVPAKAIFEKFGATVLWNAQTQKVTVFYNKTLIELTVNSDLAVINEKSCKVDSPIKIINSRTMIPLRFVAENLGMQVDWNATDRVINIVKQDTATTPVTPVTSMVRGIDVSNWQGDIDFTKVKNAGIKVVYIKATEGVTYTDPILQTNVSAAKASRLKVGVYHFLRTNDPVEEAKHFLNEVDGLNVDGKYMIDVEETFDQTPEQISSNVRQFADYLISQGKDVGIYTYLDFYKNNLNDSVKDLPVWIAAYSKDQPNLEGATCVGWQNTPDGIVDGIDAKVNLDYFNEGIFRER